MSRACIRGTLYFAFDGLHAGAGILSVCRCAGVCERVYIYHSSRSYVIGAGWIWLRHAVSFTAGAIQMWQQEEMRKATARKATATGSNAESNQHTDRMH